MTEQLSLKLRELPDSPGCYLMKEKGDIIYVGKAVNLKNRVRSYFHGRDHTMKVAAMVSRVDDFDIMLCQTNLEALILECNLIKLHKPYYNILLKDDKQYPYIRIDLQEPFPRVTLARRAEQDGAKYFGPYIGATAVRDVLEIARKAFPLRSCDKKLPLKTPGRPCVSHEIGRCLAPCAGLCTSEEYRAVIQSLMRFLSGGHGQVVERMTREMNEAAANMRYERAAQLRDGIRDIEGLMERQNAQKAAGGARDIVAISQDGLDAMAQVLIVRGGRMLGGESFPLPREGAEPQGEVLAAFVAQYYESREPAREVLCQDIADRDALESWLRERRGGAVSLLVPQRGEKRALVQLAEKNASDALKKRNAKQQVKYERTQGACEQLGEALGMQNTPYRIEGFDISNTQGVLSVASMVVFEGGEPARKEYRHYRIKTVEGANDFASMREVLLRRLKRAASGEWVTPDLILIDGGPEQLAFAQSAMREAGVDVPMFGLAKRLEEIFLPGREESILLDRHSPALHLIQRVRDEAHRFAITHHRNLRGKAAVHSQLEDIPGIGASRRRALLQNFKSIKAIREATLEELLAVEGMSKPAALAVMRALGSGVEG